MAKKTQQTVEQQQSSVALRNSCLETRKQVWHKSREMLRNQGDVTFAKGDRKHGKGAGGSAALQEELKNGRHLSCVRGTPPGSLW